LVGGPSIVDGDYSARNCSILSLSGSPSIVGADFNMHNNKLKSLVGSPKKVGGCYNAMDNEITSLDGITHIIGSSLFLIGNPLSSLSGINQVKQMCGGVYIHGTSVISHILGVFFIKGCQGLWVKGETSCSRAAVIVNRHISKGRAGLMPCQQELIEAGLADFAQI
jgi:hypothetical protein